MEIRGKELRILEVSVGRRRNFMIEWKPKEIWSWGFVL